MRRRSFASVLLTVAVALALGNAADAAQLVTVHSEFSTPFALGAMPVQCSVPMFDPGLGIPSHATLTVFLEVNGAVATLTNTDQRNPAFVFGDKFDFAVLAPGVQDFDNPSPIFPTLLTLGPLAPGQSVGLVQDPMFGYCFQNQTIIYNVPVGFYVGYGLTPVFINARYGLDVFSGSLNLDITAGTFSGHVSATYDYTPFSDSIPAPESATWVPAVFGAMCLGLVLARRGSGVRKYRLASTTS